MAVGWRRGRRQSMPAIAYIDEAIFDPHGVGDYAYLYVGGNADYMESVSTVQLVLNGVDNVINGVDRVIV